jgi:hypothetical protein
MVIFGTVLRQRWLGGNGEPTACDDDGEINSCGVHQKINPPSVNAQAEDLHAPMGLAMDETVGWVRR